MARWLHGLGVSAGEAVGPVARLAPPPALPPGPSPALPSAPSPAPSRAPSDGGVSDLAAETARALDALSAVADELERRAASVTGAGSDVLVAQSMIARDPVLMDGVRARIADGVDGAHAVDGAIGEHRRALAAAGGYLAERAADLDDIRDRALAQLLGLPMPGIPEPGHPFVLVAGDLAPADTATLDPSTVLAIVTERGGPTGHTAILAKQLGIPAVTACVDASVLGDGQVVLVDGANGEVVADPSEELIEDARRRQASLAERRARSHGPGRTADGASIPLLLNVGGPGELGSGAVADSEGVGLLRTEFLFLDRPAAPRFDEQVEAYRSVFEAFAGRRVVVRTLDVGADKPLAYVPQPDEPNPALGVRGLRLARANPSLLDDQLRAIAQAAASCSADVWVMAPMVATASEARDFAAVARARGLARVGVMIEVPAAALMAPQILAEVDFASIGTNDLAQYTLAADRLAGELAELLDPWQPALLRLVAESARAGAGSEVEGAGAEAGVEGDRAGAEAGVEGDRAGAEAGVEVEGAGAEAGVEGEGAGAEAGVEVDRAGAGSKPVGVCGEAASDPMLALVLVGLGITSLSMAPACIPDVRAALAERSLEECRALARVALKAPSAVTARAAVAELARAQSAAVAGGDRAQLPV